MPSPERIFVALSPSVVMGTLMTTLPPSSTSFLASTAMPAASRLTTSRLTGPGTAARISRTTSSNGLFSFATRLGFVVTPSHMPRLNASRISPMFAESIKNFMQPPRS